MTGTSLVVNGITYSSKNVKVSILTGYQVELKSIEYGDSMDKTVINNMNGIPIGENEGEYKADCKFTIGLTDFNRLNALSSASGGIYGLPAFPLVTTYINNQKLTSVDSFTVSIKKLGRKVTEKETWIAQEIECNIIGPIYWNGVPAYVPG